MALWWVFSEFRVVYFSGIIIVLVALWWFTY
jgi:hypothetical protein